MIFRGDEFRKEYSRLGEMRSTSVFSGNINVMALTVTASKTLRAEVVKDLGMKNPVVISVNPDKANIKYEVVPFVSVKKTFGELAEQVREEKTSIGRAIIFCQRLEDCPGIYSFFKVTLGQSLTYPPGSPDVTIIHFGCCEDAETYIQAVGGAGRDGLPSKDIVLSRKGVRQHINEHMQD